MMERVEQSRKKRVNHRKRKKWILRISLFSLLTILIVGIYFIGTIWGAFTKGHDTSQQKSKYRAQEVDINKDPFTVLFIGTDQYDANAEKEAYRTDVLMVAAVNPQKKSIKLINIPRDTYSTIAHTDGFKSKINSAAYWGTQKGVNPIQNTRETVESFLYGVPMDYYVKINFKGFIDIVNAAGGVDVNVPLSFRISTFGSKVIDFKKGPMHLNGEEALPYVRMRKKDPMGDHGRNKRQQEVIAKLLDKIVSFQSISNFTKITDAVGSNLAYSINPSEFLSLATIYKNTPKQDFETLTAAVSDQKVDGVWYTFMSVNERQRISKIFKEELGLSTSDQTSPNSTSNNTMQK
jgi:polyisoprenyl-teichoic acid--peptidoglycan teichoic acid transferase